MHIIVYLQVTDIEFIKYGWWTYFTFREYCLLSDLSVSYYMVYATDGYETSLDFTYNCFPIIAASKSNIRLCLCVCTGR